MSSKTLFCIITSVLFLIQSHSFSAQAASFDCKKATTAAEKLICSNRSLSLLDEELAKTYLQALVTAPDREKLKMEQRAWVNKSRNKCSDVKCLMSTYDIRIVAIKRSVKQGDLIPPDASVIGTWEQFKPSAGGPYGMSIGRANLIFEMCNMTFDIKQYKNKHYIYSARLWNKCFPYSKRTPVNVIKISIDESGDIELRYYSSETERSFCGSEAFHRVTE